MLGEALVAVGREHGRSATKSDGERRAKTLRMMKMNIARTQELETTLYDCKIKLLTSCS